MLCQDKVDIVFVFLVKSKNVHKYMHSFKVTKKYHHFQFGCITVINCHAHVEKSRFSNENKNTVVPWLSPWYPSSAQKQRQDRGTFMLTGLKTVQFDQWRRAEVKKSKVKVKNELCITAYQQGDYADQKARHR